MDNKKYFEAYEKLLLALVRFKELKNGELFKKYSKLIIDSFIQSRISTTTASSDSISLNIDKNLNNYEELVEDLVEDDLERYKDVLYSISEFSRFIPDYCISLLSK